MLVVLVVVVVVVFLMMGCIWWFMQLWFVVNGFVVVEFVVVLCNWVSIDVMMVYLLKLQDIVNVNDGICVVGIFGYQVSVDYVVNILCNSGFDV